MAMMLTLKETKNRTDNEKPNDLPLKAKRRKTNTKALNCTDFDGNAFMSRLETISEQVEEMLPRKWVTP